MNTIIEKLKEMLVVPVVVLDDVKDAEKLADALVGGGLPCAEVTFRTAAAEESIRIMTEKYPDMLVGAGTVLTTEQVDKAVAAGAKFIVSPGFDAEIVDYCLDKNIPILPGVISPSEAAQAVKRGLSVVKFFPAEQYGGVTTIKALAAPYGTIIMAKVHMKDISDMSEYKEVLHADDESQAETDLSAYKGYFDYSGIDFSKLNLISETTAVEQKNNESYEVLQFLHENEYVYAVHEK